MNTAQEPMEAPWRRIAGMCGLFHGWDLPLLLWPLLWSSWLAAKGVPEPWTTLSLVVAVSFARSAAWLMHDPQIADLRQLPRGRLVLGVPLIIGALCFALPLGLPGIWVPVAVGFAAAWFALRRRSFLAEPVFALGLALIPLAAWQAQGGEMGKATGLLILSAYLWLVSAFVSFGRQTPSSGATLANLAGSHAPLVVFSLKATALLALTLAGKTFGLGAFYSIGLGTAVALAIHQLILARRGADDRAAGLELWWGAAMFFGIAFHYLCACQSAPAPT